MDASSPQRATAGLLLPVQNPYVGNRLVVDAKHQLKKRQKEQHLVGEESFGPKTLMRK